MPSANMKNGIPQLKTTFRLGSKHDGTKVHFDDSCIFDAEFFPFTEPGVDPVFAITGANNIAVCRPLRASEDDIEVLLWIKHDETIKGNETASLNSITWSLDPVTLNPLLCVAGTSGKIKVFDVMTGEHILTLVGHGSLINDLATAPFDPHIIVSASEDYTLRFWNLRPEFAKNPCIALTGGAVGTGHQGGLLCAAFHRSGKYVLSGGFDARISLWTIPELPSGEGYNVDDTVVIESPHFQTSEVHAEYIDCLQFYGDLILSKSSRENRILLWKINGFSSRTPAPPASATPTLADTVSETRSAFGTGYQLLLSFHSPDTTPYYIRFGLFHAPSMAPILAIGNDRGRAYFWNLQQLEEDPPPQQRPIGQATDKVKRAVSRSRSAGLQAAKGRSGLRSSTDSPNLEDETSDEEIASALGNPFTPIKAHIGLPLPAKNLPSKMFFTTRIVAWSQDGQWCVFAGDYGMVFLFHREVAEEARERGNGEEDMSE